VESATVISQQMKRRPTRRVAQPPFVAGGHPEVRHQHHQPQRHDPDFKVSPKYSSPISFSRNRPPLVFLSSRLRGLTSSPFQNFRHARLPLSP